MKIKVNYGSQACVFPTFCTEQIKRASLCDIKVLWLLCSKGGNVTGDELCDFAGATESEVMSSLSFWRGAGVIDIEGAPISDKKPESDTQKKLKRDDKLPEYTGDELAGILESNRELEGFIGECQSIMGKMFNIHEVNIIIGLVDYLDLDFEYIMILLTYCVAHGKRTLHYAEKTAFGFYDEGITSAEALKCELQRREAVASMEGKIKELYGMVARALTTKQKGYIDSWINGMGYSFEMIRRAYEVTADSTERVNMSYTNTILERWNSEGIRTLEDVERSDKEYQAQKSKSTSGKKQSKGTASSFDTDEFFEAAIRRSLGGGEDK